MKDILKSKTMIAVAILIITVSFIDTKNASAANTDKLKNNNKFLVNEKFTNKV